MLTITDLKGETEPISKYRDLQIVEEVNGELSLSFTSFFTDDNKFGHELIQEESIVEYEGHEYRIKILDGSRSKKVVTAPHTFFDLKGVPKYDIFGGTRTPNQIFGWLLNGTGWTFRVVDSIPAGWLPNFGESNVLALIWEACKIFDCEIKIMPNKHIEIHKQIGEDNDFQFRYGHNIKTFSRSVDTTNLTTVINGYGGNGLKVTYESPNKSIFGEIHAEPIRDDEYTVASDLLELVKREINDIPDVSIEIAEVDLGEGKQLGDKVWLIYEPLGIEFQTRIMARNIFPKDKSKNTVVLGNKKSSFTDLLTETNITIDENHKQTQSRIDQTNDRITLEVEEIDSSIARIDIRADAIELSVEDLEEDMSARITITAREIRSEVDAAVIKLEDGIAKSNSLISQTATEIRSEVNTEVRRLDGEIENSNSLISQTASTIRSEVNTEIKRVDGRIDSANSSITQTASSIRSEVSTHISRVDKDIADVYKDLDLLEGDIVDAKSSITQTAASIRSEVSTDVTRLDGRINSSNSSITQLSNQITSKITAGEARSIFTQEADSFTFDASKINFVGHVFGQGATFKGNIETNESVIVGNSVDVGDLNSMALKRIRLNASTGIQSDGYNLTLYGLTRMTLNSNEINLNATQHDINLNGENIAINGRLSVSDRIVNREAYQSTVQSSANMYVTANGFFSRSSSAKRYKRDIEPLELEYAENFFNNVVPAWFRSKSDLDNPDFSFYGYIADDVVDVEPRLATYNADGEPEGFNYDRVPALLHVIAKKDRKRIEVLEDKVAMLLEGVS